MKASLISLAILFSVSANAQLAVTGSKAPVADNIFFMPTTTVVFSGIAVQSGSAATAANPPNIISPTAGQNSAPPPNNDQTYNDGIQAGMQGLVLFSVILGGLMLVSKLRRVNK